MYGIQKNMEMRKCRRNPAGHMFWQLGESTGWKNILCPFATCEVHSLITALQQQDVHLEVCPWNGRARQMKPIPAAAPGFSGLHILTGNIFTAELLWNSTFPAGLPLAGRARPHLIFYHHAAPSQTLTLVVMGIWDGKSLGFSCHSIVLCVPFSSPCPVRCSCLW